PSTLQAFWTDNRDVRAPLAGKSWTQYSPPSFSTAGSVCDPGTTGMRNANVYTSKISQGLVVGAWANTQRLSPTAKRSFVVFAENSTEIIRRYRFTIRNQPAGGIASFLQFSRTVPEVPLVTIDATVPPHSIASRTVYVKSSDPLAKVVVDLAEVQVPATPTPTPPLVPNGFTGTVVLNPDVVNPDVVNPDVVNQTFNAAVSNPDVVNPDVVNMVTRNADQAQVVITPDVVNPDVVNPDVVNPDVVNPDVVNPTINNADLFNPDVVNSVPNNPDVVNPDVVNGTLVDVTWTVQNTGNTTGTFAVKPFLSQAAPHGVVKQLLLYKTYATPVVVNSPTDGCVLRQQSQTVLVSNIPNPDVVNPDVVNPDVVNTDALNPDVVNPDVVNAQLALTPGEVGKVTLRVFADKTVPKTTITTAAGNVVTVPVNTTTNQVWNPAEVVVPV